MTGRALDTITFGKACPMSSIVQSAGTVRAYLATGRSYRPPAPARALLLPSQSHFTWHRRAWKLALSFSHGVLTCGCTAIATLAR